MPPLVAVGGAGGRKRAHPLGMSPSGKSARESFFESTMAAFATKPVHTMQTTITATDTASRAVEHANTLAES